MCFSGSRLQEERGRRRREDEESDRAGRVADAATQHVHLVRAEAARCDEREGECCDHGADGHEEDLQSGVVHDQLQVEREAVTEVEDAGHDEVDDEADEVHLGSSWYWVIE